MVNQRPFGRRNRSQPPREWRKIEPAQQDIPAPSSEIPTGHTVSHQENMDPQSAYIDKELQEWKRARRKNFNLPWRQIWLTASLCFGIASFVLPASVNHQVNWLLYALMAASAYAGFSRRRKEKRSPSQHAVGIMRDLTGL